MTKAYAVANPQGGMLVAMLDGSYGRVILTYSDLRGDVTQLVLYRGKIVEARGKHNRMPQSYVVPGHEPCIRELVPRLRHEFFHDSDATRWHDSMGVF